MPRQAFEPIQLPDWVWRSADGDEALRTRDVGALFRLTKKYAGASQTRMSAATGIPQGRISELMNGIGSQVVVLDVFERVADGLNLPDQARMRLGLAPRHDHGESMRAPVSALEDRQELLRRLHEAKSIDPALVTALQAETAIIRLLDRRLGNTAAADKMRSHIGQLEIAMRYSLRNSDRVKLAGALTQASTLGGWQAIDMGMLGRAWEDYERAKPAARESGNLALIAYATGEQAYVLLELQRADDALILIHEAQADASQLPPLLRTWLKAAEAEIHAALGDESACRTSLDASFRLLPHDSQDPDLPYLAINEAHLARWRGNCLVRFGDPETLHDLESALNGIRPGSFGRAEAALRCDVARALIAQEELEEARVQLTVADNLAKLTGSARQQRRIDRLALQLSSGTR